MRNFLLTLSLTAMTLGANGAEPAVKELIVETDWKLTGAKIEPSEKPGQGVSKMVVTGQATVGKVEKPASGMIAASGKADVIEYHVATKKFLLRGSPSVTQSSSKGEETTITGTKPHSTLEIDARNGAVRAEGPNKVKMKEVPVATKQK
jgi:hypothetical protein